MTQCATEKQPLRPVQFADDLLRRRLASNVSAQARLSGACVRPCEERQGTLKPGLY
jgi:hypothetical protein